MRVDAPGLVAAAQRLVSAVEALGGSGGVPHPPLAADPASVGAAERLTNAGAQLTTSLGAHVSALVASLEHLTGTAITFTETDQNNAAALATLNGATAGAGAVAGSAPPPPPIPPDVRAPLPPAAGMMPEALSAAAHTGELSGGEAFTGAWSTASGAARDASQHLRSAVAQLPEVLDGPASTPAASRHLLAFADGLDTYADRGHALATQASAYAGNLSQARQDIPTPEQHTTAQQRIQSLAQANAASGGRYAAPLANAVNEKNQLNEQTVTGYSGYHGNTDTATAGDDPGSGDATGDPTDPTTAGEPGDPGALGPADPSADPLSPEGAGGMASMLPQMLPTMLGAAGGLVGGLLGSVTKLPEAAMQAGTQAISAATQGLSGLAEPKTDPLDTGTGGDPGAGDLGDMGGGGGGGEAPTTPAGGEGTPSLSVAPSTGAPPTPAITPVGATGTPAPASAGMGGMPMGGMPMGGMGAPGGGGGGEGGKDETGRHRKVVSRDIPHTEDVTGRVDTNRLAVASAATRDKNPNPPDDDDPTPPDSAKPVVRRLTTRPPKEPT
jgi:hypothetical protein